MERLCRYGLRAPLSAERFQRLSDGNVVYQLKRPWPGPGGRTELVFEPTALLRRLAALIPAPYLNLVRYHSILHNRSRFRDQLPPPDVDPERPQAIQSVEPARLLDEARLHMRSPERAKNPQTTTALAQTRVRQRLVRTKILRPAHTYDASHPPLSREKHHSLKKPSCSRLLYDTSSRKGPISLGMQ